MGGNDVYVGVDQFGLRTVGCSSFLSRHLWPDEMDGLCRGPLRLQLLAEKVQKSLWTATVARYLGIFLLISRFFSSLSFLIPNCFCFCYLSESTLVTGRINFELFKPRDSHDTAPSEEDLIE